MPAPYWGTYNIAALTIGTRSLENDRACFGVVFVTPMGCEAHEPGWMERRLCKEVLNQARETIQQLADLMNHMGISKE
jgi:hypothetical protein